MDTLTPLTLLFLILSALVSPIALSSYYQIGSNYPMGITAYSLFSDIYTNFVEGEINISRLFIGNDILPGYGYFGTGNASLQLNAMIDGLFWSQNVFLVQQISNHSYKITPIVNFWNLSGPIYLNGNKTVYDGLGVLCYQGKSFYVSMPASLSLFMNISTTLQFGYRYNNITRIYYSIPIRGTFQIGGISLAGIPNDLEFVWGGPGGGSCAQLSLNATSNLYYNNHGKTSLFPETLSIGFDTAETVSGVHVSANLKNLLSPYALENNGKDNPEVLWPVPPNITLITNATRLKVMMKFDGMPLNFQQVYLERIGLGVERVGSNYTVNGTTYFNLSVSSSYFVYYPGNFTLSSEYQFASPILDSLYSNIESTFHDAYTGLTHFLSSYNHNKALKSDFHVKYKGRLTISDAVIYLVAFVFGILIAVVASKYKKDL
ncbi:thermopsin [Sulfolobales archaeon HS-7]|nr:thermopsin [Sulfolobales archaeon HS-7]